MNWDAVGAVAELAGAFAVVASLIYVGRQMSFNANSMAAAAHENAVHAVWNTASSLVGFFMVSVIALYRSLACPFA